AGGGDQEPVARVGRVAGEVDEHDAVELAVDLDVKRGRGGGDGVEERGDAADGAVRSEGGEEGVAVVGPLRGGAGAQRAGRDAAGRIEAGQVRRAGRVERAGRVRACRGRLGDRQVEVAAAEAVHRSDVDQVGLAVGRAPPGGRSVEVAGAADRAGGVL